MQIWSLWFDTVVYVCLSDEANVCLNLWISSQSSGSGAINMGTIAPKGFENSSFGIGSHNNHYWLRHILGHGPGVFVAWMGLCWNLQYIVVALLG